MRYVPEGTVVIAFVSTIASPAAPTAAELQAGVKIHQQMIGDLVLPFEGSTTDAADMSSRLNATAAGDYGGSAGTFTIHKEKAVGDDSVFTALARDVTGWLAIANRGTATANTFAINDYIDLWPVTVLSRSVQYARGQTLRAAISVSINDDPLEDYKILS